MPYYAVSMITLRIETERLVLKPFRSGDADLMRLLDSDAEVVRFLGYGRIRSEEESEQNLQKILKDYEVYGLGLFAIHEKASGRFLGRSGLIPWILENTLTWEIGYSLRRDAWGQGYAYEAARNIADWARNNLNVPYVISLIHPDNKASIRVAEKLGMKFHKQFQFVGLELSMFRLELGSGVSLVEQILSGHD